MKKLFLILTILFAYSLSAQTLQNPTYRNTTTNTLKIKTPATVTSVNFLPAFDADGITLSKISAVNLPISTAVQIALNGKQNTISNPVTGTGANGQVSFWNSSSNQIGDNMLFWDNTNKRLGINTTSPNYQIQLNNSGSTDTYTQYTNGTTGSAFGSGLIIGVNTAGDAVMSNRYSTPTRFFMAGFEAFRIHPSRGISINNTVDPGLGNLSVTGNISASNYSGSATLTGTPSAPTATAGTNTTQIATTAFVQANGRPYKSYTVAISQNSTSAPTVSETYENTLSGTPVYAYSGVGTYTLTLTGAFTANKTYIAISNNGRVAGSPIVIYARRTSADVITISSYTASTLTDANIVNAFLEIRVYN